jgi:phosphotransacetylase
MIPKKIKIIIEDCSIVPNPTASCIISIIKKEAKKERPFNIPVICASPTGNAN